MEHNKLRHLFNFIYTEPNYFGKNILLKEILRNYKINNSQTFYIGDETRDIEAAKDCNVFSIAVTWGFNSEKTLLQYKPDYIARKPEDIINICAALSAKL